MIKLQTEVTTKQWVKYFALADEKGKVSLLCTPGAYHFTFQRGNWIEMPKDDDVIPFWVVNGAWNGTFYRQRNSIKIDGDKKELSNYFLVWAGSPPKSGMDYNEVIGWIQDELDKTNSTL